MKYPTFDQGPICYVPSPDRPWVMELGVNRLYAEYGIPEKGSAHQYIIGHFEPDLTEALCYQIGNGQLMPGKGTRKVPQPDWVSASGAFIKSVACSQRGATVVRVEAVLVADLTLYARLGDMTIADQREEWFRVCGDWDLADDETVGPVWEPFAVYHPAKQANARPLDEYLIPVMNRKARQSEAEQMLRAYCPEVLERAVRLDHKTLAARMGLGIRYLPLVGHDAYLAMLFFKSGSVQVIAHDTGEIQTVEIEPDTIVLNARTVAINEGVKAAKAIIHECAHRYSHRLFLLFQQRYCNEIAYLTCPVEIGGIYDDPRDPLHWLEIQADGLTLAAQVPDATVKREAEERICRYGGLPGQGNRADIMRMVVRDLSALYGVAKRQMRKRLTALGYEDAVGAYDWVNGGYVPPYCFAPGSLGKNQTYTISATDAAHVYTSNAAFRARLNHDEYLYVEGHFCVNAGKYIVSGSRGTELSRYARAHVDECCLRFNFVYRGQARRYENGVLHQEIRAVGKEYVFDTENAAAMKKALEEAQAEMRMRRDIKKLPDTFGDTLYAHMNRRDMTVERLAETCGLSETTIKKYRRNDLSGIALRTVLSLCIALHLEPQYSEDFVEKAGLRFRMDEEDGLLAFMLRHMYRSTLDACDDFLVKAKLKPLRKNTTAV